MFRVCCRLDMLSPTTPVWINGEEFWALWDTGAAQTTVGANVGERIHLGMSVGSSHARTASNECIPMTRHRVSLKLPDGFEIPNFLVQFSPSVSETPHEVILGMDLISRGKLLTYRTDEGQILEFYYKEEDLLSGDLDWQSEVE